MSSTQRCQPIVFSLLPPLIVHYVRRDESADEYQQALEDITRPTVLE